MLCIERGQCLDDAVIGGAGTGCEPVDQRAEGAPDDIASFGVGGPLLDVTPELAEITAGSDEIGKLVRRNVVDQPRPQGAESRVGFGRASRMTDQEVFHLGGDLVARHRFDFVLVGINAESAHHQPIVGATFDDSPRPPG